MSITTDLHYQGPKPAVMGVLELAVNTYSVVVKDKRDTRQHHGEGVATTQLQVGMVVWASK